MAPLVFREPYRVLFPLGLCFLIWGALVWLPMTWGGGDYPVAAHRYLMLNGFSGCFIAGFLMTAVPRFTKAQSASSIELGLFIGVTIQGLIFAYSDHSNALYVCSAIQPAIILYFLLTRVKHRKENPPYSFAFIFVGLFFWILSPLGMLFFDPDVFSQLHYEGAIACIILGVGSRLIPGIFGHVAIVSDQREKYEKPVHILKTIPKAFAFIIACFIGSYFLKNLPGDIIRALIFSYVAFAYWAISKPPLNRTALTWCLWIGCWMIVISFVFKAFWSEGMIHISHSFFISGIVLLSLLIATRVVQSHGPNDSRLEKSPVLFVVTGLLILAAATRVSAFFIPNSYNTHLGYSSIVLTMATLVWGIKYIKFVFVSKN